MASVIVTSAAIAIVRKAMCRYVGLLKISRKFSSVQEWTIFPVNASTLQKAEIKRTTSAAM
jgi:hypothetical protein